MPTIFPLDTQSQFISAEDDDWRLVVNGGPGTIYYGSARTVSSLSNDGSITSGAQKILEAPAWIVSASTSRVILEDLEEYARLDEDEQVTGNWVFRGEPSDPYAAINIDSPTVRTQSVPWKRAAINFWDDTDFRWQLGLDVGEGAYPAGAGERADLVLGYHRWTGGGGSRDVLYLTDEEYPRVGITQNSPFGQLDISTLVAGRIGLRLASQTTASTTLTGDHTLPVGTLTVASTTGFSTAGQVVVGGWICNYTGKTATTFTGVTTSAAVVVSGGAEVTNEGWLVRYDTGAGGTVGGVWYDGSVILGGATRQPQNLLELDQGTTAASGIGFGGDSPQVAVFRKAAGKLALQGQVEGPSGPLEFGSLNVSGEITGRAIQQITNAVTLGAGATTAVSFSWPEAFLDTTYSVVATMYETTAENNLRVEKVSAKTTTTCDVRVTNDAVAERSGTLMVVGMA